MVCSLESGQNQSIFQMLMDAAPSLMADVPKLLVQRCVTNLSCNAPKLARLQTIRLTTVIRLSHQIDELHALMITISARYDFVMVSLCNTFFLEPQSAHAFLHVTFMNDGFFSHSPKKDHSWHWSLSSLHSPAAFLMFVEGLRMNGLGMSGWGRAEVVGSSSLTSLVSVGTMCDWSHRVCIWSDSSPR